jgi:hypothetical protein
LFLSIESCYSQQWVTVDSTEWESVRVSYYDSLTGNYYLGGRFDTLFGVAANGIIGYDGANWFPMGSGTNGVVLSIIRFNGDLFIAGVFDSIGSTLIRVPMAKWDGIDWVSVDTMSHFDDKFLSPNILPNIQDLCEFGGKLYLSGDFWGFPNSQNPIGYGDLARFNGSFIESFMFPWAHPNCGSCKIEVFNNELYIGKSSGTEDTCIGISKSLPDGLLKIDTTCGHFIQIGQWPVTDLNEMYSTDSLLYIGLNFPSSSIGYYVTAFDGVNFNQVGDGINGPVGYLKPYRDKLLAAGYFTGNYSNTTSFKTFSVFDGANWQSIASQCDLDYGFQYVVVLDTFIIASGFFDSCGVNSVGSIVMFPGSISTSLEENSVMILPPKVIVENGEIRVEANAKNAAENLQLVLYHSQGRRIADGNCCTISLQTLEINSGIYFLEIYDRMYRKRWGQKISVQR